ncbi:aspartyl-phosphate phosphatase Spo0E family protein [Bacillus gobiensis]|uniref:aspartyl-phosphate phosphatase Spo0E family protein n=1 Tax=Bacillus gobiensis TaxID=1441095 RepID=UPI003D1A4BF9
MILKLVLDIEQKRNEMINVGMIKGFTDKQTIKLSEELDQLINLSMKIPDLSYKKESRSRLPKLENKF